MLKRLATPYAEDEQGRLVESRYAVTTLTAAAGLISSVRDFAWFDLALRNHLLLHADTLALAWRPLIGLTAYLCRMVSAGSLKPIRASPSCGSSALVRTLHRHLSLRLQGKGSHWSS